MSGATNTMNTPLPDRPLLGALWMTGAIGAFSALAVAGRAVSLTLQALLCPRS